PLPSYLIGLDISLAETLAAVPQFRGGGGHAGNVDLAARAAVGSSLSLRRLPQGLRAGRSRPIRRPCREPYFRSDVHLDIERGAVFTINDHRMPLVAGLCFRRPDDVQETVIAAEARRMLRARAGGLTRAAARRLAQPRHAVAAE